MSDTSTDATGAAGADAPPAARAAGRRPPSLVAVLIGGGLLLLVVVLLVARFAGGDPYDTVLDAAADSLDTPLAAEVTADVDLGSLGELAPAGDGGAALGLGLLSGRVSLTGTVTLAEETTLLELTGRSGGIASLRFDDGQAPVARLDADLVGELPGGRLLGSAVPGVFGDGWVALGTSDRFLPAPAAVTARVERLRAELAAADRDTVRETWTITRAGRDEDGERFLAVPNPDRGEEPAPDAAGIDVWVDDGRISRVQLDALPFLRTELFGVSLQGGDGGLELDLRPTSAEVPPRPEPTGLVDTDALRELLPF